MSEDYEERKRKDIASFIQDGKVDWQRWESLHGSDGSYNDSLKEGVVDYLLKIGILSLGPEGNHRITGSGLNLNPKVCRMIETYFTNREQARDYANTAYSRAKYGVRIERLVDVESVKTR